MSKKSGNSSRQLVKILKEICAERNIGLKSFSYDWIFQLTAPESGKNMFIYGYKFPQNDAATEQICTDKSALSDVLEANGIPHVEHKFFMSPSNTHYTGKGGNWQELTALLEKYGKIVCKSNTGTGGNNVFKVENQLQLEQAAYDIFRASRSMCVSPYLNIKNEYRVIISNGEVGIIYRKVRPHVVGNGRDSVRELMARSDCFDTDFEIITDVKSGYIPKDGETVELSWKHNLGQGAQPETVSEAALAEKLTAIADRAAKLLKIAFASVDIIDDGNCNGNASDGMLKILEINSGVMMENFSAASAENYARAKAIYEKAVCDYLEIKL